MVFKKSPVPVSRLDVGATSAPACLLALVLALLPVAASAQANVLTLEDATQLAVDRAPVLAARSAGVAAAEQDAARAGALPDPMLVLGIDNLPITGGDSFDFSADEMTMKRIGLRQDIPARAKRAARSNLAVRKIDEARALSESAKLDVRRGAALAWIDVWAAQNELTALEALRAQAAAAVELAAARLRGGAGSVDATLATGLATLEVESRIEVVRARRSVAQTGLSRWLGDAGVEVTMAAPDFSSLRVPEARLVATVDRLSPLLPAKAQVATAAANIELARAEKRIDWSVGASYGQRQGGRSDMLSIEVGMSLPLFPGDRQDRGVSAREADYAAAVAMREDLRREAIASIRADIARWEGLKRQVALHAESMLPLARDRSAAALASYRAGGDVQSWLNAQRDELEIHLAHAQHVGEFGRAWAGLAYLLPLEDRP